MDKFPVKNSTQKILDDYFAKGYLTAKSISDRYCVGRLGVEKRLGAPCKKLMTAHGVVRLWHESRCVGLKK